MDRNKQVKKIMQNAMTISYVSQISQGPKGINFVISTHIKVNQIKNIWQTVSKVPVTMIKYDLCQ